jgi:hypothetical protein
MAGEWRRKEKENRGDEQTGGKRNEKNHRTRGETEPWEKGKRKTGVTGNREEEKKTGGEGRKQRRQNRGSVSTISSPSSTTLQPPGTQTGEEPPST